MGRFNDNQCMFVRVCAFVIWALVAGTVVFWGLRLMVRSPEAPSHSVPVASSVAARGDLTRLLGAAPVAAAAGPVASPELSARFRLLGIMAPKASGRPAEAGQGVALIAIDGKPARAYVVGSRLDEDLVLQSVSLRTASIGPAEGDAAVKLEIPPLPAPATGTLPNAVSSFTPTAAAPLPAPPTMIQPRPPVPMPNVMIQPPAEMPAQDGQEAPMPNASASKRDSGALNR